MLFWQNTNKTNLIIKVKYIETTGKYIFVNTDEREHFNSELSNVYVNVQYNSIYCIESIRGKFSFCKCVSSGLVSISNIVVKKWTGKRQTSLE